MKYLISIFLLFISFHVQAVNYLGFGGGNYVYAENGNLYFNLDQYVFDNRTWVYDETKGFSTEIKVNMDLKTKYTSDEWIEQVLAKKKSDGIMYANYIKQPFNYQNKGQYQHTWFWLARLAPVVGGQISRTASWNAFRSFAARTVGSKASGYVALGSFFSLLAADDVLCEEDGCKKTISSNYTVTMSNGKVYYVKNQEDFQRQFYPELSRFINEHYKVNTSPSQCSGPFGSSGVQSCGNYSPLSMSKITSLKLENRTFEQILNDPDLLPYFDKTCKLFPSECVNEPTDGKNVKDVVLTGGTVGTPVSVIGPPYTHPISGTSQQDQVVIGGASSGIGVNSATNDKWSYTPTLGQSGTLNPTQVTSIARPDLANTDIAPVAKPNSQAGTKPDVIVPPTEFTDINDMVDFCKANPNALSCVEVEQVDESNIEIPQVTENLNLDVKNYITSSTGTCPQGSQFTLNFFSTHTYEFSFEPVCKFAEMIKYALWVCSWLIAYYIVIGRPE